MTESKVDNLSASNLVVTPKQVADHIRIVTIEECVRVAAACSTQDWTPEEMREAIVKALRELGGKQ